MKQTVAITGAGGTLGREFVGLLYEDYEIYAIDNSEWAIAELRHEYPDVTTVLDDFDHWDKKTDYLIHCAAYKHVDLIETDPGSAILNNIYHTQKLFERCQKNGTEFMFISTDKAVEPISTYGMTKALGEKLAWHYGGVVSRSGNFLGSSGSAIPVWEKAISLGLPIPITDERMTRYVCYAKEAAKEMWEGLLAKEKLTIPTQRLVRIMDLVTEVLQKHNYMTPDAYEAGVTIIGMRPGEKLAEKLRWDNEL